MIKSYIWTLHMHYHVILRFCSLVASLVNYLSWTSALIVASTIIQSVYFWIINQISRKSTLTNVHTNNLSVNSLMTNMHNALINTAKFRREAEMQFPVFTPLTWSSMSYQHYGSYCHFFFSFFAYLYTYCLVMDWINISQFMLIFIH